MNKFDVDADLVRKLAGLLEENGLTELEYEADNRRIRLAKQGIHVTPMLPTATPALAPEAAVAADSSHPGAVTSPMVGVAYISPEPGAPAFIKVGDHVSAGQTLLLIEAMKTFNPIAAPRAGRVTRILIADGSPVEYGEALLILE